MIGAAFRAVRSGGAAAVRGGLSVQQRRAVADKPVPITVAYGDGIGPEIMTATMRILEAAGARLAPEVIEIGEKVYLGGHSSGIAPSSWDSLRRTRVFLKAPITTPIGGGYKSLNVSIRKTLGLFANVRPCVSYHPFVKTAHPKMDLVIVRENEEDTYAGIEHRQTDQVYQCLKIITRPGTERIIRYAYDYARAHNRKRVTLFTKSNIMKLTDGVFDHVFEQIGREEYPDIARDKMIVDIGAAMLADRPETFDVLVMPNLYGDIASDIAAQLSGSVGLGGSANIGEHVAMFEAIHGSAPNIAGKDVANPSGLLLGAVQMLMHIKHPRTASTVYNAWLRTLEDGMHTADIYNPGSKEAPSKQLVGTKGFADAVIARLGQRPQKLPAVDYTVSTDLDKVQKLAARPRWSAPAQKKHLHGVDVFVDCGVPDADALAARLQSAVGAVAPELKLQLITNRGVKVWPQGFPETFKTDHWRCRFRPADSSNTQVNHASIIKILGALTTSGVDVIKTENLYYFDGKPGFSLGQGE